MSLLEEEYQDGLEDDDTLISHLQKLKNKTNTNHMRQDQLQEQLNLMENYLSGPIYQTLKNLESINQSFKFRLADVDNKLTALKNQQLIKMNEIQMLFITIESQQR